MLTGVKAYAPRDNKYVEAKNKLVNNVKNFYKGRQKIIEGFKNGVFPVYYDEREEFRKEVEEDEEDEKDEEDEEDEKDDEEQKSIKVDY